MIVDPACAVCGARAWDTIGSRVFVRNPVRASAYARKRLQVLFDVWVPGRDSLPVAFILCRECGFVCYAPRPTAEDVDAKYRRLSPPPVRQRPVPTDLDRRRSAEILGAVRSSLPDTGSVLDFGGATGALMSAFLEAGYRCAVVDYTPFAVEGVKRLGETLDDLSDDDAFECIVASHVLEHLVDPLTAVRDLCRRLRPGGVLVVEVPLEVLAGGPRPDEPVTHLNYFTVPSLRALLERGGFRVVRCWFEPCTVATGRLEFGVRAIATPADATEQRGDTQTADPAGEVRALVRAGLAARARMLVRHPRIVRNPVRAVRTLLGR